MIVQKAIDIEEKYIDGLNDLINLFMNPLLALSLSRKPIITSQQVIILFGNIEEILKQHQSMILILRSMEGKTDSAIMLAKFWSSQVRIGFFKKKKTRCDIFIL